MKLLHLSETQSNLDAEIERIMSFHFRLRDEAKNLVADIYGCDEQTVKDRAKQIVLAVYLHDELCERLESVIELAESFPDCGKANQTITTAREMLAKARGARP